MASADVERYAPPAVVDSDAVDAEVEGFVRGWQPAAGHVPWAITNVGQADWAMVKLAGLQAGLADFDEQIAAWKAARDRLVRAGSWFEARLKEWAISQRSTSRKSFDVAHGRVSTRENKPRAEVVDEQAAVDWAEVHCTPAVKTTKTFILGNANVHVVEVVVAVSSIDKNTGDTATIAVASEPAADSPAFVDQLNKLRERFAHCVLEPVTEYRARTADGQPIPGVSVRAGSITASVAPIGMP